MISVFPRVEISGNYPYMQTGETRPACLSCLRVLRYLHEAAHVRTLRPDGRHSFVILHVVNPTISVSHITIALYYE